MATVLTLLGCATPQAPRSGGESAAQRVAEPKHITAATQGSLNVVSGLLAVAGTGTATPGTVEVGSLLNLGLTGAGASANRDPMLAEVVPSTENGLWKVLSDGRMETTWHVRPNTLWHDGVLFTTQDLAFTARVLSDRELGVPRDRRFDLIERVDVPDARTVTVTWKQPYIQADWLFETGAYAPLPRHLLDDAYTNRKDAFLGLPYWNHEFIGTGAFRLHEFVEGSHLTMQANDHFVLGRPKIDAITVQFIPSPDTLVANVLADSVDIVLGRSVSLQQAAELRDRWRNGTVHPITGNPRSIVPQFRSPTPTIVGNLEFRRALYHTIDRDEQALTLGLGLGPMAHVGIPLGDPVYRDVEPAVVKYEYDPRKAIAMLESLGFSRRPDGVLRNAGGQPLEIGLRSSDREVNVNVVLTTADYWKKIGVQAYTEVVPLSRSIAEPEWYSSFPAFQTGGGNFAAVDTLDRLRPDQVPSAGNGFTGQNTGSYVNADLISLIDRYFVTIPMPERIETLRAIFHHISDQVVVMPLYYDSNASMISNGMVNALPAYFGNAHQWDKK